MFRQFFTFGLVFLTAAPLYAAPRDYEDSLPADVLGMTPKEAKMDGDRLIVFYGESIGRATVTIMPAPDADPNSASANAEAPEGQTPAAQLVLTQQLSQNLSRGTNALGDDYKTEPARIDGLEVDDKSAICGIIERRQAEEQVADGKEPMILLDRVCTAQLGDDVVSVYVTTPISENMREKLTKDQLGFSAIVIATLTDEMRQK
ncbi:hypothetical protein [Paracoccus onubensis]|uniref:Uncharacterized protein n=1 Tax=Paracoccus onubensis TaxID=1675788 RepID=A0A418T8G7_9RHOB|nr:hypothetical protein [Paracoccus onubensis]RJE89467.1 hypothetical protein D3P04_02230 [Paracoccus onubensis]